MTLEVTAIILVILVSLQAFLQLPEERFTSASAALNLTLFDSTLAFTTSYVIVFVLVMAQQGPYIVLVRAGKITYRKDGRNKISEEA